MSTVSLGTECVYSLSAFSSFCVPCRQVVAAKAKAQRVEAAAKKAEAEAAAEEPSSSSSASSDDDKAGDGGNKAEEEVRTALTQIS